MKKIISILLIFALCITAFPLSLFAQDTANEYTEDEKEFIYLKYADNEHMLEALFNDDSDVGYWNMINNIKESDTLKWSIDVASMLIEEYPDEQDYAEILSNLIMMQSGDIAEQVQNQSQYDDLKDGVDYAMDIAEIASNFVCGANILKDIEPIIDAATNGAEVIVDNIEEAKYYETTIKDYSRSKMFLEAVSNYAENEELRSVAKSLLEANDSLLGQRLEYLGNTTENLANYEAKFFIENLSFELLKNVDLYKTDETVKWYVDCGSKLTDSILSTQSAGEFTFKMMMLAGDIGFGTSDTFNRYQEMKIVSDVAGAIIEANSKITIPQGADVESVLNDIRTKCDYYKMLITTHARGEYLLYRLLINDASLLSDFRVIFEYFKDPADTTDSWYAGQIDCMTEYYNVLDSMFEVSGSDVPHGLYDSEDVPDNAVEFNGHYYYVYEGNSDTDWNAAKEFCEAQGGYLATVTTAEEDAFLYSYIIDRGYGSAMFGLTDQDTTDVWTWVTGEKLTYENWQSGEPNHQGNYEHYGMYYDPNTDGSWNDGSGIGGPFICEWGEYDIDTIGQNGEGVRTTSEERDVVLALDASGSMEGTPLEETKKASVNFIDTVLDEDASIGTVSYSDTADMLSDFSVNKASLKEIISNIYAGGGTNIEAGLAEAHAMLNTSGAKKKIIVLMSDGEPTDGKIGDELVGYADEIKKTGALIYTLGFFENMGDTKSSAQMLMERIASEGCHYEVSNADDLVFFFEDMADQINGQKYIYIRIACPVDVSVTYEGQTLCSADNNQNLRTDFGTLSFEETEEMENSDEENRIKVLRLKEGVDYDVEIAGTGHGIMNYTIGFMDENGDYSDFRWFNDIKITRNTIIHTVARVSEETVLNIDQDGDGKTDLKLQATENEYGKAVKMLNLKYYIIFGSMMVLVIAFVIGTIKAKKKNRRENV